MAMDDFSSGVSAIGGSLFLPAQNQMMEEDRNQRQQFNSDQAYFDRMWQEHMSSTSYQRQVADMKAAGINPMLLIQKAGGASTPGGAVASTGGTAGYPSMGGPMPFFQNVASATQAQLNQAAADKTRAEEKEIIARTQTYEPNIELTRAKLEETVANIGKIIQETKTGASTAANLEQQTENLKETVSQIRATVIQLRGLTALNDAQYEQLKKQGNLTDQQVKQLQQLLDANLPQVERHLKDLELPKAGMEAATHSTPIGALSAILRALNPLTGIIAVTK